MSILGQFMRSIRAASKELNALYDGLPKAYIDESYRKNIHIPELEDIPRSWIFSRPAFWDCDRTSKTRASIPTVPGFVIVYYGFHGKNGKALERDVSVSFEKNRLLRRQYHEDYCRDIEWIVSALCKGATVTWTIGQNWGTFTKFNHCVSARGALKRIFGETAWDMLEHADNERKGKTVCDFSLSHNICDYILPRHTRRVKGGSTTDILMGSYVDDGLPYSKPQFDTLEECSSTKKKQW